MAFTADELASIANAALDYHWKGQPLPQNIQDKPLLAALEGARKDFPGGKGSIDIPVKGKYKFEGTPGSEPGNLSGYTHDDTVSILLGVGDGTFQEAAHYGAGDVPYSIATGDFNGDLILDLASANK